MSTKLFDGSDDSDNDLSLGTNKDYAKSYNKFRQKELLKKFKDRGLAVSDSNSSSDSDSSEEDEVLDPKFDQEFFKTLASLKSKDPAIYDKNTKFFDGLNKDDNEESDGDDEDGETKKSKQKKLKPVTLKDYERKVILEKGGKFEDDSDAEQDVDANRRAESPTFVEEERRLRAEFKKVMNADDDSEEEFGGVFRKRVKTKEETDKEEEDFVKWLAGKKEDIQEDVKQKLEPLKNYWSSSKLPQSERFLRDYILNKGYADTNLSEIPTYDEIVGDTAPLSEDEEELEKQAEFEHKYNFRFEEPDAEFITRYPRTIENTVRRTDDKRKQKRQEIKERKKQEKEQKMKELEIVKEMKRKEIEEKIKKLKMVTGNEELGFKDEELEDDFDPDAHDRRMQEIFNDEYYQVNEGEEKPECPSDIEELKIEDWDNFDPQKVGDNDDYEPHCEDDDFNMDCDFDPAAAKEELQKELIENTKGRRNRKGRKNRFMELIKAEKPAFNPEDEKTYGEYIDEYYKMDCEDIIGDIPCRFKYVETTPNDFGLTIEEILLAKNKELNQWASLKKAIQIRPDYVEKKEQRLYKLKAKNEELKRKIFKSIYGEGSDEETEQPENIQKTDNTVAPKAEENQSTDAKNSDKPESSNDKKPKKKRKRKAHASLLQASLIENSQNDAVEKEVENNSEVPKKIPKIDDSIAEKTDAPSTLQNTNSSGTKNKKKKKKKLSSSEAGKMESQKIESKTSEPNPLEKKNGTNIKNPFNSTNKNNKLKGTLSQTKQPLHKNGKVPAGKFKNKFSSNKNRTAASKDGKDGDSKISDERLKAYGINPKKFHKKKKYGANK